MSAEHLGDELNNALLKFIQHAVREKLLEEMGAAALEKLSAFETISATALVSGC